MFPAEVKKKSEYWDVMSLSDDLTRAGPLGEGAQWSEGRREEERGQ